MAYRLKDYADVRRYLAGLINRVEADKIPADKAAKLTFIANTLLRAIEAGRMDEIERRLAELEEEVAKCEV